MRAGAAGTAGSVLLVCLLLVGAAWLLCGGPGLGLLAWLWLCAHTGRAPPAAQVAGGRPRG